MDPNTLEAWKALVEAISGPKNSFSLPTLISSIVVPVITGIALAVFGYILDGRRKRQIEQIEVKTKLLDQKLEQQNAYYEKLLSFSSENKRQSMLKAMDLYGQIYDLYWRLIDSDPNIRQVFDVVKRSFYQNALFLPVELQNTIYTTMLGLSNAMNHLGTPFFADKCQELSVQLKMLSSKLTSEYDLVGTRIEFEELGRVQQ